ncbi:WD40-repeat-containing domain protein [Chytridium lagenaria]|nr:WD40-repeat-containing domain protein [Chytridium lagenaria]
MSSSSEEDLEDDASDYDDFDINSHFSGQSSSIPVPETGRALKVRSRNKPVQQIVDLKLVQHIPGVQSKIGRTVLSFQTPRGVEAALNSTGEGGDHRIEDSDQALGGHATLKFNRDGRYLAFAGGDAISSGRGGYVAKHYANTTQDILSRKPDRIYKGHALPILDVSWSANDFLLSSSMDFSVRLWHATASDCLSVFTHSGPVLSVSFHPHDDRYFISGDSRLRLWSLNESRVINWVDVPRSKGTFAGSQKDKESAPPSLDSRALPSVTGHITAVSFNSDGSLVIAGTADGELYFYEFDGLRYNTQVEIILSRSRVAKGPKVDSILVTTNDSNLRLYNLRDKSLIRKFRGPKIRASFVKASFSQKGNFILCGSENRRVYLINTEQSTFSPIHQQLRKASDEKGYSNKISSKLHRNSRRRLTDSINNSETRVPVFTGVLNGLLVNWNSESGRNTQYESFVGSSDSLIGACFAPDFLADAWDASRGKASLLRGDGARELLPSRSAYILTTDSSGAINAFECRLITEIHNQGSGSSTLKPSSADRNNPSSMDSPLIAPAAINTRFEGDGNHFEYPNNSLDFAFEAQRLSRSQKETSAVSLNEIDTSSDSQSATNVQLSIKTESQSIPSYPDKANDIGMKRGSGIIKAIKSRMARGATIGALAKPSFLTQDGQKRSLSSFYGSGQANKDPSPLTTPKLQESPENDPSDSFFVSCLRCGEKRFSMYKDGRLLCLECQHIQYT